MQEKIKVRKTITDLSASAASLLCCEYRRMHLLWTGRIWSFPWNLGISERSGMNLCAVNVAFNYVKESHFALYADEMPKEITTFGSIC